MVFAEADNLPALIIDKYQDYFVCQLLSLGIDQRRDLIVQALKELFNPKGIYERSDAAVRQKKDYKQYAKFYMAMFQKKSLSMKME